MEMMAATIRILRVKSSRDSINNSHKDLSFCGGFLLCPKCCSLDSMDPGYIPFLVSV
jgi:hypothetical protein